MKRPLPVLDLDLLIEHGGHQLKLRGSKMRFVARFPTLLSLLHFLLVFWPYRKLAPRGASFRVEWRQLRIPVKTASEGRIP